MLQTIIPAATPHVTNEMNRSAATSSTRNLADEPGGPASSNFFLPMVS
ncbi:hypothetical protein ACFXGT_40320 [Streptomyces sp. NPDC059352]